MSPFAPWKDRNADDSIINAAARHHKPDTYLQWVIATADRLASGFEREEFEAYNRAPDDEQQKLNHYTTRQLMLLEQLRLAERPETRGWRYPLRPLSPESIFPVKAGECEKENNEAAQKEYRELWKAFYSGLADIPKAHRQSLSLWLDHFDSLWLAFTHVIPSATAGNVKPEVSLYDHSKTTAALAVALWRFHADQNHEAQTVREQLRAQWDRERGSTKEAMSAWNDEKFLLI
jgi:CRISPR-associated protein Csm1